MVLLTREQLEERLAALHQASLELVSNLSLETVLQRLVELACDQVNAEYGLLGIVDEQGQLVQFVQTGMSAAQVEQMPHPPRGLGLIGALQRERRSIRIPAIDIDPRSVGYPEHHPHMRSFLGVPIVQGEQLLGQLYLTNKKNWHEFTENDQIVIEMLAAYAASAIVNARLYEGILKRDQALYQRNEDLALTNDIAAALAGSLELEQILEQTLQRVMDYLHVEAGEIWLCEENETCLRLALHKGEAASAFWSRDVFRIDEGFIGLVAGKKQILTSDNLADDSRYLRTAVVEAGFRSMVGIPLIAQQGKVVGVVGLVSRQPQAFREREISLLRSIGVWAGTAIENAWLHRRARQIAVLEERERIGMDLHDGIIQSIYAVGLVLDYARMSLHEDPTQALEKINQAVNGLNRAIRDIRAYILDLRPRQFREDETIVRGVQRLADEFRANSTTTLTLSLPEQSFDDLPTANAIALFHICQEALANIAKHAQAGSATLTLWGTSERVLLEISDDGRGFDLARMSTTLGHGLSNMHRRARRVGGDVEMTSEPGEGTTVLAWVPRQA
ncbi:MAG: two-component system sensor histidine kinase [Anaerolineales bacterium]